MANLVVKLNDTYPPVEATLESTVSGSLAPIDLTPATSIFFIMKLGVVKIKELATVIDAVNGKVQYKWKAGDTSTVGIYRVEWEIHWTGGIETIPNEGYDTIEIQEDLG
jgi:hypothetical protein